MTHTWDKKQASITAYERVQMLDLADKAFEAAIINRSKKLKETA